MVKNYGKNLPITEHAILWACENNNLEIVKVLINVFGDKLPIDSNFITFAYKYSNIEIVKELVKNYGDKFPIVKECAFNKACENNKK